MWGGSRDCQAPLQWRRALPCLVKVPLHRRLLPESYPAELPPPLWAQHRLQCSSSARLWAAACVPGGIWPFGGRNARRRPKRAKKTMEAQCNQDARVLFLCDFRSCDSSATVPERWPTSLSTTPLKGSRHRVAVINVIASCDGKCALDTHGALNSVDHCTQGPPLRRSCASTQSRPGLYN